MIDFPQFETLCQRTDSKIIMLVVDGLGGLPHPSTGRSELESADLPNLDHLSTQSATGLTTPVAPGISPGSGPGHTALFGYDPIQYLIGRGVLEALGLGIHLGSDDIAIRCNFCTIDNTGTIVDRRAGRISDVESSKLVHKLGDIKIPGIKLSTFPGKGHRFVLVLSGDGLSSDVSDTDPSNIGLSPLKATAVTNGSEITAETANAFVEEARGLLSDETNANMVLLRGFSQLPTWPQMNDKYLLNTAAVAAYPMYRGLAQLIGMEILETGESFGDELDTLEKNFEAHDFFFLHYKPADAAGEDGDFGAKVKALEALDSYIPRLRSLGAETLVVAGDHSTPSIMSSHSWHPVPLLIHSSLTGNEGISSFCEKECSKGSIGRIQATSVMALTLANAGKLLKFGP